MPIEFAPPSPNLQGFNVPPPQSTDPLQTLAQMGQLRTQGLQQQTAGMQLEQERQKLDSNKALLAAMVNGGGDIEKTYQIAANSGKVLPGDLIAMREHHTKMMQDAATLDKTTRENTATDIDRYRGLLSGVQTPEDLAAANENAEKLGIGRNVPRHMQFSDPQHVQAFSNSLAAQAQVLKEATERATREREEAATKLAGVQTTEADQKVAAGERAQAIAEIQAATDDTGVPNPADWAAIQARHPKVLLPPGRPTAETVARFVRSGVTPEKQPEYDLNAMKARLGLLGNSEFDQYQLRYAQGINKKPNELTFPEFQNMLQTYAKDRQDPNLLSAVLALKGAQQSVANAQVASLPNEKAIDGFARDLLSLDMAPSQFSELRSGRVSWGPQVIQRAREIAEAEGKPFSMAALDAKFKTWEDTEKKFATGPEAQMARSFDNLMQHTGLLDDARKALSAGDLPSLKRIANFVGVQSGGTAETTYDTIADFVAAEAGKAFLPSGGGEGERAKNYSHFERGLGNEQIANNIKSLMHLADSQRQGLENQYDRGTFGKGQQKGQLFSPGALATRDRLMGKKPAAAGGKKIIVKAGDGSLHPFDTEAQAKTFEDNVKAAGGSSTRQ